MPKRIVDGDAIWRSMKLRKIEPPKYRAEVANLIPLALANGAFEVDPALVWAQVYAFNRPDVTPEDVVAMLDQFEKVKMLFRYEDEQGKWWGYWIGIATPGRLPPPSERNREKRGMEPPEDKLREFLGASYPAPRTQVGAGSLGNGKGTGTGRGKGTGSGTGDRTGQQSQQQVQTESNSVRTEQQSRQQSKTKSDSGLGQMESPVPALDHSSVQSEDEDVSSSEPATPPVPQPELADIRDWQEDRFGISGERLRNCILYQLDFSKNDWYRTKAEITVSKINSKVFVTKLDADTPPGWTPERANARTTRKPTDNGISKATQEMVAKFGGRINE